MRSSRPLLTFCVSCCAVIISSMIALGVGELVSRWVAPLAQGATIQDANGNIVPFYRNGIRRFIPNTTAIQVSQEFNAPFTITSHAYRGPDLGYPPEVVILGDSFTFGVGLTDEQTFAAIACRAAQKHCANLGLPGSGTGEQIDLLEERLVQEQWRPKKVVLVPLIMTGALFGGNDLEDNLRYQPASTQIQSEASSRPTVGDDFVPAWHVRAQQFFVSHSNLYRLVKYKFGVQMRSVLSPGFAADELQRALEATKIQLERAKALSQQYNFSLSVLVIHPMQDIARKTAPASCEAMQRLVPDVDIHCSGPAFSGDASQYYFPFDGHFNAEGAATTSHLLSSILDYSH